MTREEANAKRREYRRLTNNADTKTYEKTKKGFLMRMYRNMQSRILGIQWKKEHLYKGKCLMTREDFYNWAMNNDTFHELFNNWELSKHDRRLAPSIDRINSELGYSIDNVQIITFSENCKRTARNMKTVCSRCITER